jgi:hypothetical protein
MPRSYIKRVRPRVQKAEWITVETSRGPKERLVYADKNGSRTKKIGAANALRNAHETRPNATIVDEKPSLTRGADGAQVKNEMCDYSEHSSQSDTADTGNDADGKL